MKSQVVSGGAGAPAAKAKAPSAGTLLLQLLASVQGHDRGDDAATTLCTELAMTMTCDRVSIGLWRNDVMELIALSHQALGKEKPAFLQLIVAAMEESASQASTLVLPAQSASPHAILLAHGALSARVNNEAVLTVPLVRSGKVRGALLLERTAVRPFNASERHFCEHVGSLIGPVLELKCEQDRALIEILWDRLRHQLRAFKEKPRRVQVVLSATLLALVALCVMPVQYRVTAPAHLEGQMQRAMAAPADGYIKAVYARPGDQVNAGQLLAEINDEEFRLERNRRESELAQLQSALGDALAKHDYSQIGVLSAKQQEARANLELATQQLQRTRIEAPFDGVVIKGDLSQAIGTPVRQGDTLLVMAPAQGHRVILDVDERDIADIKLAQSGRLTLAAFPSEPVALSIKRVTPMAVARDGRNYFEVEASTAHAPSALRPGLQGVAKVDIDRRMLVSVWGRDAWNWLRLTLWSLLG